MSLFINYYDIWKKLKLSNFKTNPHQVSHNYYLVKIFYLYGNSAYLTIYNIIKPYKNYLNYLITTTYNYFNKKTSQLYIIIKYVFALY